MFEWFRSFGSDHTRLSQDDERPTLNFTVRAITKARERWSKSSDGDFYIADAKKTVWISVCDKDVTPRRAIETKIAAEMVYSIAVCSHDLILIACEHGLIMTRQSLPRSYVSTLLPLLADSVYALSETSALALVDGQPLALDFSGDDYTSRSLFTPASKIRLLAYSARAGFFAGHCLDGTLRVWDNDGNETACQECTVLNTASELLISNEQILAREAGMVRIFNPDGTFKLLVDLEARFDTVYQLWQGKKGAYIINKKGVNYVIF